METQKYFFTRPILASRLKTAGCTVDMVANPWNDRLHAWETPLNNVSCAIITKYLTEIGKPIPDVIRLI